MNAFKKEPALYLFILMDLLLAGVTAYFYIDAATYWDDTGIIAENERTTGMIWGTFFLLFTIGGLIFIIHEIKDASLNARLYDEGLKRYEAMENGTFDWKSDYERRKKEDEKMDRQTREMMKDFRKTTYASDYVWDRRMKIRRKITTE